MATFTVTYVYDDARAAEIDAIRPDHRAFLAAAAQEGSLLASGPWTEGNPGALLVLRAESAEAALALLDEDPFRVGGLILERTARGWNPVIGRLAE